jgi:NAD(P)-dependent dehydrogenase (short-subunit alcohol dehydrogenase family)
MTDNSISTGSPDGLIAVVTGAAQGLGMAERLAREGATVIIADLQREKAQIKSWGRS